MRMVSGWRLERQVDMVSLPLEKICSIATVERMDDEGEGQRSNARR